MKKILLSLSLGAIILGQSFAQTPTDFAWAKGIGTAGSEYGFSVATGPSNTVYAIGAFQNTITLGSTNLVCVGGWDTYVAKLDSNGNYLWANQISGSNTIYGNDITVDANGNVYVTGEFNDVASFGATNLTSAGSSDIFIAKYNGSGVLQWAVKAGGTGGDKGRGIAVDSSGNVVVTGDFFSPATFGSTNLTGYGAADIFVAKYDNSGTLVWVKAAGGSTADVGREIATDKNENIYVTGDFSTTATFATTNLTSSGQNDAFLAKYKPNGDLDWVKKGGGTSFEEGLDVHINTYDEPVLVGRSKSTSYNFSGTSITVKGGWDMFIVKYAADGTLQWVKNHGNNSNDYIYGVRFDANGGIAITGSFSGTSISFGTGITLNNTEASTEDMFIAKLDADGNGLWAMKGGATDYIWGRKLAIDSKGSLIVSGDSYSAPTFGTTTLTHSGSEDVFICKIQQNITDNVAPVITLTGEDTVRVKKGDAYAEQGATAFDYVDGDLTDSIQITGTVNTSVVGNYTLTYSVSDAVGNSASVSRIVVVYEELSNTEMWSKGLSVFPNPSAGIFNIDSKNLKITSVRVYDYKGQQILIHNFEKTQNAVVDLSAMPDGIYLISIVLNEGEELRTKLNKF